MEPPSMCAPTSVLSERGLAQEFEPQLFYPTFVSGTFCVFDPRSHAAFRWKLLNIILMLVLAWIIPYEVAFNFQGTSVTPAGRTFAAIFTCIFFADILFNFNVARTQRLRHQLLTDRRKLARAYARGWLFIDVIGAIPWELVAGSLSSDPASLVAFLRLLKLLRLIPIMGYAHIRDVLQQALVRRHVDHSIVLVTRATLVGCFMVHFMACGLYLVPQLAGFAQNEIFLSENGLQDSDNGVIYLTCFYWATMTVTTIGYGDVATNVESQRAYVVVCMAVGAALWAYLVGLVILVLQQRRDEKETYVTLLSATNHLMDSESLDGHLRAADKARVRRYLIATGDLYSRERLRQFQKIAAELSPELRYTVLLGLFHDWVRACPWLLPRRDPELFADLIAALKETIYAPLEALATRGNPCNELAFVRCGRLVVMGIGVRKQVVFGLEAILSRPAPHYETILAVHFTQVWSVGRFHLHALAEKHPHMGSSMRRAAAMLAFRRKWLGVAIGPSSAAALSAAAQFAPPEKKRGSERLVTPSFGGSLREETNAVSSSSAAAAAAAAAAGCVPGRADAAVQTDMEAEATAEHLDAQSGGNNVSGVNVGGGDKGGGCERG